MISNAGYQRYLYGLKMQPNPSQASTAVVALQWKLHTKAHRAARRRASKQGPQRQTNVQKQYKTKCSYVDDEDDDNDNKSKDKAKNNKNTPHIKRRQLRQKSQQKCKENIAVIKKETQTKMLKHTHICNLHKTKYYWFCLQKAKINEKKATLNKQINK